MSVTTQPRASATTRRPRLLERHLSAVVAVAFALSAAHTTYGWLTGIGDPRFTVTTPVAWVFYAAGAGLAALARSRRRWAEWTVLVLLVVAVAVAVFWYPTTFTPRQQTWFGWFENDVYTGLLLLAAYLAAARLSGLRITRDDDVRRSGPTRR